MPQVTLLESSMETQKAKTPVTALSPPQVNQWETKLVMPVGFRRVKHQGRPMATPGERLLVTEWATQKVTQGVS
jgi:hypothetical protein